MQLTTPKSFVALGLVGRLHAISEVSEFVSFESQIKDLAQVYLDGGRTLAYVF